MVQPDKLIHDLTGLGNAFLYASGIQDAGKVHDDKFRADRTLSDAVGESYSHNQWFIPSFVSFACNAWAEALKERKIARWIGNYHLESFRAENPRTIAIIMAGNIPMVGLHDLICILASGYHALIKLSASDDQLIPAIIRVLCNIDPELSDRFIFSEGPLRNFDAIIATGSNNSSRYFDYYFGRFPHIIRKNRNSVAVITGHETGEELKKLADDIFMYFGLGCRNVSKLYLPAGYEVEKLFPFFEKYSFLSNLHKYLNNYDYQKSILLINRIAHSDNGFLLIKPDTSLISPVSVVHTEFYSSVDILNRQLSSLRDKIQCIVSCNKEIIDSIAPGKSQFPELWDYADNIDTMEFLMNLQKK